VALSRRNLTAIAGVAVILLLLLFSLPIAVEPRIKQRLVNALGERFDSEVQLEALTVSLLPRPRLSGRRLVLRHKHRTDVPPLVTIASFWGEADLVGLLSDPVRVSNIRLEGLEINVPPGGLGLSDKSDQADQSTDADDNDSETSQLIVRNLQSERAVLRILRRQPGKAPRVFEIGQLDMKDVGADHPWPFRANLTNPTPPGHIQTEGTFGPWQAKEPSQTPLAASYRFENGDLGVFDGIAGILNSSGAFKGVLERIEVDGTTSMRAFTLADVGNGMPLETRFHSIVDGTNGNTLLQPVEATLGATKIHAAGGVVEREGEDGRTVELDVVIDAGRLEDILRLAVKGPQPPMTGVMKLRTKFLLPPGDRDVIRKLRLDGNFSVDRAEFTKAQVQDTVDAFSTKARGVKDDTPDPVVSNFRGTFKMRDGAIHFSNVTFAMPGAGVSVSGRFLMESEALDFRGIVRLDAKLSQLTTGVKSFFLRTVDGLFRHDDITVVPITIGGTADKPKVGLDFGKAVKGG
jgi:AsmA-like C-terminal region